MVEIIADEVESEHGVIASLRGGRLREVTCGSPDDGERAERAGDAPDAAALRARFRKDYFTSSLLFSRKLEHIKRYPKVSVLFSHKEFTRCETGDAVLVKGTASVDDSDPSNGWMRLLPLWRKKEPYIDAYLKQRFAFPLFWERAVIEVVPEVVYVWRGGDMNKEPEVHDLRR
jgi:hypothetical protein